MANPGPSKDLRVRSSADINTNRHARMQTVVLIREKIGQKSGQRIEVKNNAKAAGSRYQQPALNIAQQRPSRETLHDNCDK